MEAAIRDLLARLYELGFIDHPPEEYDIDVGHESLTRPEDLDPELREQYDELANAITANLQGVSVEDTDG